MGWGEGSGKESVTKLGVEMELHKLCVHQAKLSATATPPPPTMRSPFLLLEKSDGNWSKFVFVFHAHLPKLFSCHMPHLVACTHKTPPISLSPPTRCSCCPLLLSPTSNCTYFWPVLIESLLGARRLRRCHNLIYL